MHHFFRANDPNPTGQEYEHKLDKREEQISIFKYSKPTSPKPEEKEAKIVQDYNPCAIVTGQVPQNRNW